MNRAFFDHLSQVARAAIAEELSRGLVADNKASGGYDPVTEADRAAERALRTAITERYPDHGIWGEEYGWTREGAETVWSLDPVDGTRALVCGLPSWSVLVGLLHKGRHVGGMIDLPVLDERIVGLDGETRRNGHVVKSSLCASLSEAKLSTTDPYLFAGNERGAFEKVRQRVRLARFGLDAMAYARIATGDIDVVIENNLKRHDYDALVAVVEGSGGSIGNWNGGKDLSSGRIVAASSETLYLETVSLLSTEA